MKRFLILLVAVVFAGCVPMGGNIQVTKVYELMGKKCQSAEIQTSWSAEQLLSVCADQVNGELAAVLVKVMENMSPEEREVAAQTLEQMYSGSWQMAATPGRPTAQTLSELVRGVLLGGALIYGASVISDADFGSDLVVGGF